MKNHLKCQLAAACVSVYFSSLDNDNNIKLKVLKMYKRTFIRNNNIQECGSSNKAEGKGRWRERQCGRFLKFLIIIAILFPPASKQVIVCGPFLSLWSLSTFCSADWRFSKREREILEIHCLTTIVHYPLWLSFSLLSTYYQFVVCNVSEMHKKISHVCSLHRVIDKDDIFRIKMTPPPASPLSFFVYLGFLHILLLPARHSTNVESESFVFTETIKAARDSKAGITKDFHSAVPFSLFLFYSFENC